jgi:hypothetical protein
MSAIQNLLAMMHPKQIATICFEVHTTTSRLKGSTAIVMPPCKGLKQSALAVCGDCELHCNPVKLAEPSKAHCRMYLLVYDIMLINAAGLH